MEDFFSKCGFNCGRCPTYKENLRSDEDRQRCSDAWKKYFNLRLKPEKLRRCDGCQTPDDENPVRYVNCTARKCAVFNSFETCAVCSEYPCDELSQYWPTSDAIQKKEDRLGSPIPEDEYLAYVEPYEGQRHLNTIRASLTPDEIKEVKKVTAIPKLVDFPNNLSMPKEKINGLRALYKILSTLECGDNISYARQLVLKKRRQHILKTLWAFGRFGKFENDDNASLILDSETYSEQKIHSYRTIVTDYIETLKKHGVYCDLVPLDEEKWLTPTGGLRKKGWFMRMLFHEKAGGLNALKSLIQYTSKLYEIHGKDAFRYFVRADMRIFYE